MYFGEALRERRLRARRYEMARMMKIITTMATCEQEEESVVIRG